VHDFRKDRGLVIASALACYTDRTDGSAFYADPLKQIKTTNGKETNMERRGLTHCGCFILLVAALLLAARPINAQLDPGAPELTVCSGSYALCAAATCSFTGQEITDNAGTSYPEVLCKCPVLPGPALANVTGGNMQGDCLAPLDPDTGKTGVWSLFWPNFTDIPQEINGVWHENVPALPHNCPKTISGKPVYFGQCFSYSCKNVRKINRVLVADCYCPAQTISASQLNEFAVEAGQCQESVCIHIPVGAPFIVPGNFCKKESCFGQNGQ
jgi:hypothetical protein